MELIDNRSFAEISTSLVIKTAFNVFMRVDFVRKEEIAHMILGKKKQLEAPRRARWHLFKKAAPPKVSYQEVYELLKKSGKLRSIEFERASNLARNLYWLAWYASQSGQETITVSVAEWGLVVMRREDDIPYGASAIRNHRNAQDFLENHNK